MTDPVPLLKPVTIPDNNVAVQENVVPATFDVSRKLVDVLEQIVSLSGVVVTVG